MADLQKTIEIIFEGTDKLGGVVGNIGKSLDGFESTVGMIADPLAKVADGVLAVDAALAAMAVGGMAAAVHYAGEFGGSFSEIATLIDAPLDKIDAFRSQILEYGKSASVSFADINAAVYTAISAGTDYTNALDVLRVSEQLAIGGRAELEASTKLLASTMNAYGADVELAGHYSDVFFQTVKLGQTTIPELAQTLSKVTGIAAAGQVPIETLASAIAALTATGVPTSEAMTSIKAALSNIIKPSSEAATIAKDLGLSFDASTLASKGFEGVLKEVYETTGGSVEKMSKLFGSTEALNAVLVLAQDSSGKFSNALAAMADTAGATRAAYEKMANDMALTNQHMVNNIQATMVGFGTPFLDEYKLIADGLANMFQGVSIALDAGAFSDVFDYLEALGRDLASLVEDIAQALPEAFKNVDFSNFLSALDNLGSDLADFFGDLDLTDPEDLTKALQGVVDTLTGLVNITAGMAEQLRPVWDAIVEGIGRMGEMDVSAQKAFGNILGAAELVAMAGVKIAGAMVIIKESGADIENVYNLVGGSIKAAWNVLQVAFDTMAAGIVNFLYKINDAMALVTWGDMSDDFKARADELKTLLDAIDLHQAEQFGEMLDGAAQAMDGLTGTTRVAAGQVGELNDTLAEVPPEVATDVRVTADSAGAAEVQRILNEEIPATKDVAIAATADEMTFEQAYNALHDIAPDEKQTLVKPVLDTASAQTVADDLAVVVNDENTLEIQAKIDIANIEAAVERAKILGETVQTKVEWQAKLDIAEVEAQAKILESAFSSIDNTMTSTGDTISSLFGMFSEDLDMRALWAIEDQIRTENDLRQKTFVLQEKLTESQIKYMNAKTEALASGDMNITVAGEGLQPHMEAFMWEILTMIQIRANAEAAEFLIGVD